MADALLLPSVSRDVLPSETVRIARLQEAAPQIESILQGEYDEIAVLATLACLFSHVFSHANFCGFYRLIQNELVIGPYQGSLGCFRIDLNRGMCGRAARERTMVVIDDVHLEPEHIACDSRSRSELVIPIIVGGKLRGVMDVDSPFLAAFSLREGELAYGLLDRCLRDVSQYRL
jgi:L-methionine (R)-S-oxide reductase